MTTVHVDTTVETRNPIGSLAPLDMLVAIGFGQAVILCDGLPILDGEASSTHYERWDLDGKPVWVRSPRPEVARTMRVTRGGWLTLGRVERYLVHRERSGSPITGKIECFINGPLWGATWERKAPGQWVCTEAGMGFA